ncbi:MAG: flagellar hook-associated protein FlgL [candidate division FCPU426 bacterium]
MRISTNLVSNQIIENLNVDLERLTALNNQTSTGRRIQRPSDDPLGAQRVTSVGEAISRLEQYQRNSTYVTNWINATESALTGVNDALRRANSLAVRGANDATLTQTELDALASEVNGILENIYQLSNTTLEGRYLFSGYQTATSSYQAVMAGTEIASVNYTGDAGVDQVEIDQGQTVNKNLPGSVVFQPAAGIDVFATLVALRDDLRAGNQAAVAAAIATTETARQQVADQVSILGNKTNQLEGVGENLATKKNGLVNLESQLADVDMPSAIVELKTAENIYTAALESSARIMNLPKLMDFLG